MSIFKGPDIKPPPPPPPTPTRADASILEAGQRAVAPPSYISSGSSQGLKRNVSDPYGVAAFMNALASGDHARFYDDAAHAFSQDGIASGNDILGQLFGSKELSRAVAAQAAQATGLGQDVLKQMLPAIAAMLMGGMFKQSTGRAQAAQAGGFGGADNPLADQWPEAVDRELLAGLTTAPWPRARS